MIPLNNLNPRAVDVLVVLKGGQTVKIGLRPFSMRDHAWFQDNFKSDEEVLEIAKTQISTIAKIAWNQMDVESKKIFTGATYIDVVNGKEIEVRLYDEQTLVNSLESELEFHKLLDGYLKTQGLNGFITEAEEIGLKKKIMVRRLTRWIGLKPLISWLRNTVIRPIKSLT